MNNSKHVSVVICTYNRPNSFKKCLESVMNQTCTGFEIVIIDDHSDKEAIKALKDLQIKYPNIVIQSNDKNMGLSYSRNRGAELSSNDIVVFIDDDCVAKENWLFEIIRPFENDRIAMSFGSIEDPTPINLAMVAAKGHYKRFSKEGLCDSVASGGGNMAVRKQIFLTNSIVGYTLEDWELCQKVKNAGYLIYYNPKAAVIHEHYHNLKTILRQRYRYGVGHTWHRKKYKSTPVNLQMFFFMIGLLLLPFAVFWSALRFSTALIFFLLIIYLFIKDFKKGEKTFKEAIVTFPLLILIAASELLGRLVALFKKPSQINYGTDRIRKFECQ